LAPMDVHKKNVPEQDAGLTMLQWARKLQALAQTGLTYTQNPYDIERYNSLREIAAEIMAASSATLPPPRLVDLFACELGYATPKVDVRAAVFVQDRLLLVKERSDGGWTLPGGWADVGDSPGAAAVREVKEESGYDVIPRKLAAVYDRDLHGHPPIPYHAYKLFFLCELAGGAPQTSFETEDVSFFPEDNLPPLSLSRVTPKQISHLFGHYRHPEWPTSFD
jgi:ADP-ribose pyrophosphatase YjhB (NUDIX family)